MFGTSSIIFLATCIRIRAYVCAYVCNYVYNEIMFGESSSAHMYVCMLVCMYVWIYLCMYICMYINLFHITCMCVCIYIYVCVCVCVYTYTYIYNTHTYIQTHKHTYIQTYIHTCIHTLGMFEELCSTTAAQSLSSFTSSDLIISTSCPGSSAFMADTNTSSMACVIANSSAVLCTLKTSLSIARAIHAASRTRICLWMCVCGLFVCEYVYVCIRVSGCFMQAENFAWYC
jgi:hypothetical protein